MKLISWNIQWCRGCDGRVDPKRIVEHARALADFDVLCLQEVAANFPALAGSSGEDQFAELAALLPGYTAIPGIAVDLPDPQGGRRQFGNLILSRLPVGAIRRIALPWPSDPGFRSMPRMVLQATIQTAAGPVRVMTTHLEYYSALQRSAQVDALRSIHHEAARHALADRDVETDGGPFQGQIHTPSAILTGDFNFRPDDALYTSIQADIGEGVPRWVDAWTVRYPGTPHAHTSGVHDRNQWPEPFTCDFVFASENLRSRISELRVDGRTQASDHQPILLALD